MTYLRTKPANYAGGPTQLWMDTPQLAADLAAIFGATPDAAYPDDAPFSYRAGFTMPDGLHVSIFWRSYGADAKRVELSAGLPAISRQIGTRNDAKFPSISVDPARPIAALAKDIKRRLIDASAAPRAALEAAHGVHVGRQASLAAQIAALRATWPLLQIAEPDRDHYAAKFCFYSDGASCSGRLSFDGALYFDSVSPRRQDSARAVLAALLAPEPRRVSPTLETVSLANGEAEQAVIPVDPVSAAARAIAAELRRRDNRRGCAACPEGGLFAPPTAQQEELF